MESSSTVSLSHKPNTCFFNSQSHVCAKREVITLIVLGVLGILMGTAALYGYLADPSWMVGAHILAGATTGAWALAGILVLAKTIQTCRHQQGAGEVEKNEEESKPRSIESHDYFEEPLSYTPRRALELIFFNKTVSDVGDMQENLSDVRDTYWTVIETINQSYFSGRFKSGEPFYAIKYQTVSGALGGVFIYPDASNWHIKSYSNDGGKGVPMLGPDLGDPNNVEFLATLIGEGKNAIFQLRA